MRSLLVPLVLAEANATSDCKCSPASGCPAAYTLQGSGFVYVYSLNDDLLMKCKPLYVYYSPAGCGELRIQIRC